MSQNDAELVQSGIKPALEGDVLHCFSGAFWCIIKVPDGHTFYLCFSYVLL
jgi:hypothetical protein